MYLSPVQHYLKRTIFITMHLLLVFVVVRFFLVEMGKVNGQSMEPNFTDGEVFVVNKVSQLIVEPKRHEVVQVIPPYDINKRVIKRIIGLPGETVTFRRNKVYIARNGDEAKPVKEEYLPKSTVTSIKPGQEREIKLGEQDYFVIGDNRLYSQDSRDYGPVPRNRIVGGVILFQ